MRSLDDRHRPEGTREDGAKGGRTERRDADNSAGSTADSTEGITMKLRYLKATYALALLVAFVVAAGAGSKFHGNG